MFCETGNLGISIWGIEAFFLQNTPVQLILTGKFKSLGFDCHANAICFFLRVIIHLSGLSYVWCLKFHIYICIRMNISIWYDNNILLVFIEQAVDNEIECIPHPTPTTFPPTHIHGVSLWSLLSVWQYYSTLYFYPSVSRISTNCAIAVHRNYMKWRICSYFSSYTFNMCCDTGGIGCHALLPAIFADIKRQERCCWTKFNYSCDYRASIH